MNQPLAIRGSPYNPGPEVPRHFLRVLSPGDPRVGFARAKTYIDQGRNLDQAQKLLHQYLDSPLTPDDPPKSVAEKLLRQTVGG